MSDRITCGICGCRPEHADEYVRDVEAAIEEGWAPSYYEGQDEVLAPVCPDCQRLYLHVDVDGELVANGT